MIQTDHPVNVPEEVFDKLSEGFATQLRESLDLMRTANEAMNASTLRGMSSSPLSFAQTLVRRMVAQKWSITLEVCEIEEDSTGFMAYEIRAEDLHLSFGVFIYPPLPPGHLRLFRDTKVEFLGVLLEGPIDRQRLERERKEFDTNLWRGRSDARVYGWTVASRGTRMFDQVVDKLVDGEQPTVSQIDANGGYLLRNGGFYGNGRMGTRAWRNYSNLDGALAMPYHIDLFCVYLWRLVSLDLVEATSQARNPHATLLEPHIRRHIGIGNSSGLGTVAALIRWPRRLSSFILPRELAFAYTAARHMDEPSVRRMSEFIANAAHAYQHAPEVSQELLEPRNQVAIALLKARSDLTKDPQTDGLEEYRWVDFLRRASTYESIEAVEILRTLLLEVYPETWELSKISHATDKGPNLSPQVNPRQSIGALRLTLHKHFSWVLKADLESPGKREYFWYRSEENGENRRGERSVDVGVERETFVDVAGAVRRLADFLAAYDENITVGEFLLEEPEHTLSIARVQLAESSPYSEIHASVCDADFIPGNAIRCFLAILGIELPTPHSGRWVRGLFYRDAPLPEDLAQGKQHNWGISAPPVKDTASIKN